MYYYTNILCTDTGVEIEKVWEKSEIKTIFKLFQILFVNSAKYTFLHPNGLSWGACTSLWRPLLKGIVLEGVLTWWEQVSKLTSL